MVTAEAAEMAAAAEAEVEAEVEAAADQIFQGQARSLLMSTFTSSPQVPEGALDGLSRSQIKWP